MSEESFCFGFVSLGPFASCHDFVDPVAYHESCVYDLCATLPEDDVICSSLETYADVCRLAGSIVDDWRAVRTQCGMLMQFLKNCFLFLKLFLFSM